MMIVDRTYDELIQLDSFIERFEYLKLNGQVGSATFGYDRFVNQAFYSSPEWRKVRRDVIIRDEGRDLGVEGFDIQGRIIVHHINPISLEDLESRNPIVFNKQNLICVSHNTHEAIHYGDGSLLPKDPTLRFPGDTKLW